MTKPKVEKAESEWRAMLTPQRYEVLREKGTERAFTGEFWDHHDAGTYRCAGCGEPLFASDAKFDSGCGWPSFTAPLEEKAGSEGGSVAEHEDRTYGMRRVEVTCARCGGHLGHVFPDGPGPTGLRYCINSASLEFEKKGER